MNRFAVVILTFVVIAPACSTEKPTVVADANATATSPNDAGSTLLADAPDLDAGMPADAGDLTPDAGAHPVTTTGAVTAANTGGGEKPADGKGTPFDRILFKPKVQGGDPDTLKAAIEKKTGMKIVLMRKTAGKWYLVQFVPTAKGRDEGDQKKLVDVMKGMDEIASVEGDRLMKVKQP